VGDRPNRRWLLADALFTEALDRPEGERMAFLKDACDGDPELLAEVEDLLEAEAESSGFMAQPVDALTSVPWDEVLDRVGREGLFSEDRVEDEADRSGERIGPYRLLRKLGRGGMATVYLAERADGLWTQEVALKLVRRGLDTVDVLHRFRAERQILSGLDHPNIGRLLDGGTTDHGLPYLVMEYVRGSPITEYCDEEELSVEQRLRLFCDVCRAVQHAHQSLVVHRDLKPSNILVTPTGQVKLLDFGIAKILDPSREDGITCTGRLPLTPEYASPEQVGGGALTTASDVYQLGMLLCELLAGQRPYEIRRGLPPSRLGALIRSAEPAAPSSLVTPEHSARRGESLRSMKRRLRGDLDTIVLHAIPKVPEERYSSAEALVGDVERHLAGRPIRARRPTVLYRARKLIRRRPFLIPGMAAGAVMFFGYLFTLTRHSADMEEQRNLARLEAERAEEVQNFLIDLFRAADPYTTQPEMAGDLTVRDALSIGADRVRSELGDRPALQATLLGAIGEVYANLDLMEPAIRLQGEALELERTVHGAVSAEVAVGLRKMGTFQARSDHTDSARILLSRSLELARSVKVLSDTAVAGILVDLGRVAALRGHLDQAETHLTTAVEMLRDLDPPPASQLARAYTELLDVYPRQQRMEQAREAAREAVRLSREAYGDEHPRTALALVEAADLGDWEGGTEASVPAYREAIGILDRTLGPRHQRTLEARNNLAVTLRQQGELEAAEDVQRQILASWLEKPGDRSRGLAASHQNLAVVLLEQGRMMEAERHLLKAMELYDSVLPGDHYLRAFPRLTLATVRIESGDFVGAEKSAREAAEILGPHLDDSDYITATANCRIGQALAGQGRVDAALPLLEASVETLTQTTRPSVRYELECRRALAELYRERGEPDLARVNQIRIRELEGKAGGS